MKKTYTAIRALSALLIAAPASAQLAGTGITGSVQFGSDLKNYFDAAHGYVPAGYGNSGGSTTVSIGSGTEFGFADDANTDTANFTDNQLILTDVSTQGTNEATYMFTALRSGAFSNVSLVSSSFSGLTYSVAGDTLTIGYPVNRQSGTFAATFDIMPAVPEPATWAMMLLGFAGIGVAMGRRGKPMLAQS